MFERSLIAYIYAETPIHPGSGTAIGGIADLPIQRERHTGFPIIQGSSLKGVLRNCAETIGIQHIEEVFGKQDHVGGISVTDARILAFPVRALEQVFVWVTCPIVLDRYRRDLRLAEIKVNWNAIPRPEEDEEVIVPKDSNVGTGDSIYIEELRLKTKEGEIREVAGEMVRGLPDSGYEEIKEKLEKDLVIVSDSVFREIVSLTTEVVARIKIRQETGTVQEGGLWYEEYLPTDTLMYSLILVPRKLETLESKGIIEELMKYSEKPIQIGGDETVGKGFARIKLIEGD